MRLVLYILNTIVVAGVFMYFRCSDSIWDLLLLGFQVYSSSQVYGYGGVSIVVEVLTDKITRSVARVREVVKDYGGKMADPGSVMFKFRHVRVVNVKVTDADKDQLLDIALDAGAEDVIEPSTYEDDTDEDGSER